MCPDNEGERARLDCTLLSRLRKAVPEDGTIVIKKKTANPHSLNSGDSTSSIFVSRGFSMPPFNKLPILQILRGMVRSGHKQNGMHVDRSNHSRCRLLQRLLRRLRLFFDGRASTI